MKHNHLFQKEYMVHILIVVNGKQLFQQFTKKSLLYATRRLLLYQLNEEDHLIRKEDITQRNRLSSKLRISPALERIYRQSEGVLAVNQRSGVKDMWCEGFKLSTSYYILLIFVFYQFKKKIYTKILNIIFQDMIKDECIFLLKFIIISLKENPTRQNAQQNQMRPMKNFSL